MDVVEIIPKWGTSSTLKPGVWAQQELAPERGMLRCYISGIENKGSGNEQGYPLLTRFSGKNDVLASFLKQPDV